jgi:CheY-like chemotaxis protein
MAPKILIVDDNVFLAKILKRILVDEGFEVDTEMDGQKGYAAYLLNRPDVILTDIHMPGGDGLQLVRKIRRHDPEIPAIYMSGDWLRLKSATEEEDGKPCVRFLPKPFLPGELMKLLSECLSCCGNGVPHKSRRPSPLSGALTT